MHIDRPIAIGLIVFIIILLLFFLVVPEYKTFQNLQTNLGEKKAEYIAEYDYYSAIDAEYFNLLNHKDDIEKIDNALPGDSDFGFIIYYLQKTAKTSGLNVKDIFLAKSSAPSESKTSGLRNISFSMDVVGDYAALENFIISLEKSARIYEISTISFSSSANPPYTFNLQIKTHSY